MKDPLRADRADETTSLPRLLTRAQVARRLDIGVSSVRRLEGHALHPVVGIDGVHRFDPNEVEAHRSLLAGDRPTRRKPTKPARAKGALSNDIDGRQHARAFRLFEGGRSHAEVVIEAGLPSPVVRQLHAEWRAGYRQPLLEPDLAEEDANDSRKREEAAWDDWERKMQALSSDLDARELEPPRAPFPRAGLRWRRMRSPRL